MLRDGDRVDVNRIELAVRVDGSVQHPGLLDYAPGRTVDDYIQMAGGVARRGDVKSARLTRAGSGATVFARDIHRLEPGDFVYVPEKNDLEFWGIFRDVIIVTAQIATIVLVVNQLNHQ
jgi:protein involved in polysaccharide export with SLBB domain